MSGTVTAPRIIAAALAAAFAFGAQAKGGNEDIVKRHFATLVASPAKTAELTMFMTMMPKGGDLHHHYSGAIYAEQYLEWVDRQGYCVSKTNFRITSDKAAIEAERAKPNGLRTCVSGADLVADNDTYRKLLQKWSTLDFHNHSADQAPPDQTFFDTFGYFGPVASTNTNEGLRTLKTRAIAENLSYIETIFELAPMTPDAAFDQLVASPSFQPAQLDAALAKFTAQLEANPAFARGIADYVANVEKSAAGIDDERFTMRYQPYVLRFLSPSAVYSQMLASFKLAQANPLIVGVNIVGQESLHVSMRDYSLHMQMFRFLKVKYPEVKTALHAGELRLGIVPPEGLTFHIAEAVNVAGANRIGHGLDIAHEQDALAVMKTMRERRVPVEVNLTSNEFILGVKHGEHPVELYRRYGVPFVLSTDDAGVTRHSLSNEYVLFATRYETDYAEVKKLSYDSIRYAFLAETDRKRLLKQLDERFARFEAQIAGAVPGKP
ncbi:adenosine deaminase family protein [Pseudoduganella umbonata]|uniref:adenosine deaminase n=1 Tax=Pseudoduganella umbonata TaxID=864828 RepID=A0A4P8HYC0_9BURK|nr:adenosine deaminase [Pseudoduganella umbonata]MBB3223665.1 adenosine deaminase/adenosine deaminase CECR1 [Pseudoduganella umbonata]QCP13475.1 adenosine deaminase [Pseudoduganella umbonata]